MLPSACLLFEVLGYLCSKQNFGNTHAGGILNPKSVHEGFRPLHTSGMIIHTRGIYLLFAFDCIFGIS